MTAWTAKQPYGQTVSESHADREDRGLGTTTAAWIRHGLAILVSLLLTGYLAAAVLPSVTDLQVLTVRSGSMEPAMRTGGIVVVDRALLSPDAGEVATFTMGSGDLVTHRVVAVDEQGLTTKGDANADADIGTRLPDSVVGTVVFDLPYAGYVITALRQPAIFFSLLLLSTGYLIWGELQVVARFLLHRSRKHHAPVA